MKATLACACLFFVIGCKPALLPGTEIEDTQDTRAVYDVISAYRVAMEAKSTERVMALVAKDFFDTSGTEDPADDYGYNELESQLHETFGHAKVLRLEIHLKDITVDGDTAFATYRYKQRAHMQFPAGAQWTSKTDVNKIKFLRVGEKWKISSGI